MREFRVELDGELILKLLQPLYGNQQPPGELVGRLLHVVIPCRSSLGSLVWAMKRSDVFDELLELVAIELRTAHRTEKRGQSGKHPVVRGHISRKLAARYGGEIEELLLLISDHAEELGPTFEQADVLGRRGDSALHLAPIAWVNAEVGAALSEG